MHGISSRKKHLVIAFPEASCPMCGAFAQMFASHAADLREQEAMALLVFAGTRPPLLPDFLASEIICGSDIGGCGIRMFLGENTVSESELSRRGVFVIGRSKSRRSGLSEDMNVPGPGKF